MRFFFLTILLIVLTLLSYNSLYLNDFVDFDDNLYVVTNMHVQAGLSLEGIKWAFKSFHVANWHPLTWLSHMLDVELFGLKPLGHHMVNLGLHAINVLLLFWVLTSMTGVLWSSGVVAALFAVHPLHVESVAWVAERKDVLSALFWMLGMVAYLGYVKRKTPPRYLAIIIVFALGLLAKSMIVTLPLVLLLMDFWPLGRFKAIRNLPPLAIEKIPLLLLSAASGIITIAAQKTGGTIVKESLVSFNLRLINSLISYAWYIGKMFWPSDLACFYPFIKSAPALLPFLIAAAALLLISALAGMSIRRRPYVFMGWMWYVITLLPVIGLLQVGAQSRADRYTYLPLTGLFIIMVWLAREIAGNLKVDFRIIAPLCAVVIAPLVVSSNFYVGHWRDSVTLFKSALKVTADNAIIRRALGRTYLEKGLSLQGIEELRKAALLNPDYFDSFIDLGSALYLQGRYREAIDALTQALHLRPDNADVLFNLGLSYHGLGLHKEEAEALERSVLHKPNDVEAHFFLGLAYSHAGDLKAAFKEAQKLESIDKATAARLKEALAD